MFSLRLVLAALVLSLSVPGFAQETLVVTKAGYFLVKVDATGNPTLVKIDRVITIGDPPPDAPTDPTDPPAVKFRTAVKNATAIVFDPNKTNTKKALAQLYRTTSQLPVQNKTQLVEATNVIFAALQLPQAWVDWKAKVDAAASFAEDADKSRAAWEIIAEVLEMP
jgi:hypothetical protein